MAVVEPGRWYLFVICQNADCGQPIVIGEDPNQGEDEPVQFEAPEAWAQCPMCRTANRFSILDVHKTLSRQRPPSN